MKPPLLTIIIPSFNYGRYLRESLDSILSQDFEDYEVLLMDDGSTDETPVIAQSYAEKYPHIRYCRRVNNLGIFATAEEGRCLANGKYLHFFSADDRYLPQFLSKSIQCLQEFPDLGLVCSNIGYFQEPDQEIKTKPLLDRITPCKFTPKELLPLFQTTGFWIPGTSCIVKKELLEKYGSFDPKLENISDWFLFHEIALFEGVGYIPETLIAMRQHPETYTSRVKRDKTRRRATFRHLLKKLNEKNNRERRHRFNRSTLLAFIFKDLFWKIVFDFRYIAFWPYIYKKK